MYICIMGSEFDGILLDYSRQCATLDTLNKLKNLAEVGQWLILPSLWETRQCDLTFGTLSGNVGSTFER